MAHYTAMDLSVDETFFMDKLEEITGGKLVKDNPNIFDYLNFYGSTSKIALLLVDSGMYNNYKHPYNAAIKQVQRMLKNPDIRLREQTQTRFSVLSLPYSIMYGRNVVIRGWYSYDGIRWAYATFRYSPSDMEWRNILYYTSPSNSDANRQAVNAFLDAYGVGIPLDFSVGTTISM